MPHAEAAAKKNVYNGKWYNWHELGGGRRLEGDVKGFFPPLRKSPLE